MVFQTNSGWARTTHGLMDVGDSNWAIEAPVPEDGALCASWTVGRDAVMVDGEVRVITDSTCLDVVAGILAVSEFPA